MVKKEITYKGKSIEDIKNLSLNEYMKIVPARQRRSLKRGFTAQQKLLLDKIKKFKAGHVKKPIKTHCRNIVVVPEMIGLMLLVHNGKDWTQVNITAEMLGHYLGEFTLTRKRVQHSAPGIGATKSSAAVSVK